MKVIAIGDTHDAPDVDNAFGKLLRDYDLNMDDLGNLIAADVSESARILQKAGQAKKLLSSEVSRLSQSLDDVMSFDLFGYDKQIKDQMADAKKLLEKHDVRGFVEAIDPDGAKGILGKTIAGARELDALRLGLMTSQTATISTSLIFLNAVAWALAIPPVPTIANLIIFYNYDLLDSLLLQLVEQDLFFPCYQYLLLFCLSTNQMFFQDKPNE